MYNVPSHILHNTIGRHIQVPNQNNVSIGLLGFILFISVHRFNSNLNSNLHITTKINHERILDNILDDAKHNTYFYPLFHDILGYVIWKLNPGRDIGDDHNYVHIISFFIVIQTGLSKQ